ncbi:MAG TPA: hypothetical protein VHC94_09515 [Nitrobacter sp.]|jgi:hypothetical protein|nr:hypothetical protein [Nitrobacter sp.]
MKKAKTKASAPRAAKAPRSVAKTKTPVRKAAKQAAKPVATKTKAARPSASKNTGRVLKTATPASAAKAVKPDVQPLVRSAGVASSLPRTLPTARTSPPASAVSPAPPSSTATPPKAPTITPKPPIAAPKSPPRADIPPAEGFAILVDGHFKNQFETLAQAKQAGTELKARFPILRIEVYDATKKARLPL